MAFTMPAYKRSKLAQLNAYFAWLLGGWWLLLAAQAQAADGKIEILHADTQVRNAVYTLNAEVNYSLSEEAIEALKNSIALVLVLEIEVKRKRNYLWDETIATLKQAYKISHYNLSDHYIVDNLNTGISTSYSSLYRALRQLGQVRALPLLDRSLTDANDQHYVELYAYLDIESLPAPMRASAYLSPAWRLYSETYACPLNR